MSERIEFEREENERRLRQVIAEKDLMIASLIKDNEHLQTRSSQLGKQNECLTVVNSKL
jgi:chromosome segregation ATPase